MHCCAWLPHTWTQPGIQESILWLAARFSSFFLFCTNVPLVSPVLWGAAQWDPCPHGARGVGAVSRCGASPCRFPLHCWLPCLFVLLPSCPPGIHSSAHPLDGHSLSRPSCWIPGRISAKSLSPGVQSVLPQSVSSCCPDLGLC